jgi:hypothetical protein
MLLGTVAVVQGVTFGTAGAAYPWECITMSSPNRAQMQGSVCVRRINNGYDARYTNRGGYAEFVNFNLVTPQGTYGDRGPFWTNPGETRTYFFAVGDKGCQVYVNLYDRAGSDPRLGSAYACY